MEEREVTESWKEKNYEWKLTEFYFGILNQLRVAQAFPIAENLKIAFSSVKAFANGLIYSTPYLKKYREKVEPVLGEIEKILYGNYDSPEIMKLCRKYKINIKTDSRGKRNKIQIINSQNIIEELWNVFFLVKQWAYAQGFFAKKPYERRFGKEAMEDVMNM